MGQKIVQLLYNDHPLYKKCMEYNTQIFMDNNIAHTLKKQRSLTTGNRPFTEDTDIERMFELHKDCNAWYMDCDCIMIKYPDFEMEKGCPYFSFVGGIYDTWAILGNGCQWFFDYMISVYEDMNCNPVSLWNHRLINNELKDKIRAIPPGYFKHFGFNGSATTAQNTGKIVAGKGYSIQYTDDNWNLHIS